jgi:hypothetical protein
VVSSLVIAIHKRKIVMKTRMVMSMMLVVGLLGTVMPMSQAQAFSAQNFHGNICQVNSPSLPNVVYGTSGIEAVGSSVLVRCPLMTVSREVASIGANVKNTSLPGTSCVVQPLSFTGELQGNAIPLVIPAGDDSAIVPIPEASKGPTTFYQVRCALPKGQTLTSINVVIEP